MKKIFVYAYNSNDNFGFPSLMSGLEAIVEATFPNSEIIFYQSTRVDSLAISHLKSKVCFYPLNNSRMLIIDYWKYRFGLKSNNQVLFNEIKRVDVVLDLYGICFCSNFNSNNANLLYYLKSMIRVLFIFPVCHIAKMMGKKTVKCPASYGPIRSAQDSLSARYSANKIFDLMIAREHVSKEQICSIVPNSEILVSPDLANLMPYDRISSNSKKYVSISISHQIIKQWSSDERYIDVIVNLINHILSLGKYDVYLIPNEINDSNPYNDIDVAKEIYSYLESTERVNLLDVRIMNAREIKSFIASSEALVASRYHSCVAGLSSGVPTFIIGWHYKYLELLQLYSQEKWIIPSDECSTGRLMSLFDEFWKNRFIERSVIADKFKDVREKLLFIGEKMFSDIEDQPNE